MAQTYSPEGQRFNRGGAPGVTRTPGTQFRKLLSVSEVLDISIPGSGLAGPRRAWTAAAASETRGLSATGKGQGFIASPARFSAYFAENSRRQTALEGPLERFRVPIRPQFLGSDGAKTGPACDRRRGQQVRWHRRPSSALLLRQ